MDKIDANYIRKLNPCKSGIDNFEKHYPKFKGTIVEILNLDKVPYSDKAWLATKVCTIKQLQWWSVYCAESVLPNFEKQFPNDIRVRDCINVVKDVLSGKKDLLVAWSAESAALSAALSAESAALSAALSAESAALSAAWSAALSAAWSAESAAWSALSAAWSAESAALSAAWSAESEKKQEQKNIELLIKAIKENP